MISKWFFISVIFVVAFSFIAFFYYATSTFPYPKPARPAAVDEIFSQDSSSFVLQADQITYFLNELGAYQLHNRPVSSDIPRLEVVVDGRTFGSQIIAGITTTHEQAVNDPDLRIISSKEEIFKAIRSGNVQAYAKKSLAEGKMSVEQLGSYSEFFSKGYLNMYRELTGKSLTGNVMQIVSRG